MVAWWQGLTERERVMLGVLGAVFVLVVGFFGLYQPVSSANASAKSAFERMSLNSATFQRSLTRYQLSALDEEVAGPAVDADAFRADIAPMARAFGLTVSRLQPTNDDHLLVTFEQAAPEDLFSFLIEAQSQPGGKVIAANLTGRDAGRINAVIEFQGAGT